MKKVVYGIVILIGLLCISTNFIINEKNIDFKKTSASGTACKWISESGYGMGPYYVTGVETNATKDLKGLQLLTCNTSNSGTVKNGNKLYNQDGSEYSGEFTTTAHSTNKGSSTAIYEKYTLTNGLVTAYCSKADTSSCAKASQTAAPASFLGYYISMNSDSHRIYTKGHSKYPGSEQTEWNFTCVCAEY